MQYSKEHKSMHWSFCQDFYCKAHGSMNQTKNRCFSNSHCAVCGTIGHGVLNCPLAEEVIQKEKECKAILRTEHNNHIRILQENGTLSWIHTNDNESVSSQCATVTNAIPIDVPWN